MLQRSADVCVWWQQPRAPRLWLMQAAARRGSLAQHQQLAVRVAHLMLFFVPVCCLAACPLVRDCQEPAEGQDARLLASSSTAQSSTALVEVGALEARGRPATVLLAWLCPNWLTSCDALIHAMHNTQAYHDCIQNGCNESVHGDPPAANTATYWRNSRVGQHLQLCFVTS
jgi:hypothetical protein